MEGTLVGKSAEEYAQALKQVGLPERMASGLHVYIEHGLRPGGFLGALLENNLIRAFAATDDENGKLLERWVQFLFNTIPASAWGSKPKVDAWIEKRRMENSS